ncbi:hypothetical protein [Roseinatronobacter sp. NSM]|uniref:hypothetical protein n=1 Tax=Roseinatronobacter sp. NSM TaxID=3457785 RepID=UPI00403504C9
MITLRRKYGDTLRLRFHTTAALRDVTITAASRNAAGGLTPFNVAIVDRDGGIFEITPTTGLPVGRHSVDIRYDRAGQTAISPTFFIQILEAMTP